MSYFIAEQAPVQGACRAGGAGKIAWTDRRRSARHAQMNTWQPVVSLMSTTTENASTTEQTNEPDLLDLAAHGAAKVVAGATQTLTPSGSAVRLGAGRAIQLFGPPILQAWRDALGSRSAWEQQQAVSRLGRLSGNELRQKAAAAIEQYADGVSPEDRALAVEYLSAIPVAVRRCAGAEASQSGSRAGAGKPTATESTLLGLLPTDVPPLPVGADVPGTSYRLEELLGIGGFGAVYKAVNRFEQNQPPRAIKFCLDPEMVPTLHRERDILDRLMAVDGASWSNRIVRLYGYALDATPPFLVYEFVSGGDLTSRVIAHQRHLGQGLPTDQARELIRQIVEALAFAHGQGLVHRDLKPANVLLSASGVKLTDFGIGGVVAVHVLDERSTAGGLMLSSVAEHSRLFRGSGTPLYMSPEQRRGDEPDPRHDLYSLGVLWYQLLIGDVTRELHPGWPDELREECQTPEEDIQLMQRCVGYIKKRPAQARDLLALFDAPSAAKVSASGGASAWSVLVADDPRPTFDHLHMVLVDQIDRDALLDAYDTARELLRLQPDHQETKEALVFLERRLQTAIRHEHDFASHKGWVRSVALSPDGRLAVSGGDDGTVRVWDLLRRQPVHCLTGHTAAVMSVAFDPQGRSLVSAGWDGTARIWDIATGRLLQCLTGPGETMKCVAFAPDGRRLLTTGDDRCIHMWDASRGERLGYLHGHTDFVQGLGFTADSRYAVSGSDDGTVRVWDLAVGKEVHCLRGHEDTVTAVTCARGQDWLLSASSDRTVILWDLETGKEIRRLPRHDTWVNTLAITPDGRRAVTGSGGEIVNGQFHDGPDTSVRLWDLATGHELCRFTGHPASVTSLAISSCGGWVVTGALDCMVRLLRLPATTAVRK